MEWEREREVSAARAVGGWWTHTHAHIDGASWVGCKRGVSRGWARVMVTGCAMVWWPALILHPRTHVSRETYSWWDSRFTVTVRRARWAAGTRRLRWCIRGWLDATECGSRAYFMCHNRWLCRAEAHGSGWCRGLPPNRETDAGTGRNGCPKLDHSLSPLSSRVMQREIIIFFLLLLFYFRRDIIRRWKEVNKTRCVVNIK